MWKGSSARIDRRRVLRLGALGGALASVGCAGDSEPGKPTGPPLEKGNRSRLEKLQSKAAAAKGKTK